MYLTISVILNEFSSRSEMVTTAITCCLKCYMNFNLLCSLIVTMQEGLVCGVSGVDRRVGGERSVQFHISGELIFWCLLMFNLVLGL